MSNINEIIDCADSLCKKLDELANEEKKFCDEMLLQFERYSWEVYRMKNSIQELQYAWGQ